MKKNKKKRKGIMYSTDTNFKYQYEEETFKTIPNIEQNLRVCIEKHRAGKIAIIIKGFIGSSGDLRTLEKLLKKQCGVGGSAKNGEIIIQGDIREKVIGILENEGYNYKRVGG
ncbi:MAG: translation initiation factor [Flavobacteriales bacterium]|nr:translation initiation factor [Flavobacteriales bacterium]|tara:strand:+ start:28182 stop:28520 length:339 start_codon:yes stop_codon:yes gene_type:complete